MLDTSLSQFSYGRWNVVSLHDGDYIKGTGSIKEKLIRLLEDKDYVKAIARITLVTNPRYFGYIFNPVSFFYCHDAAGKVLCIVAEVNNTFKERHFYILDEPSAEKGQEEARTDKRFQKEKVFHVSPFNDMEGTYTFIFTDKTDKTDIADTIRIQIILKKKGETYLHAELKGIGRPLDQNGLRALMLHSPVTALFNVPRILWQAGILYFKKGLDVHMKPIPNDHMTMTLKSAAPFRARIAMDRVLAFMHKFKEGRIIMNLPDHGCISFGDPECNRPAHMHVKDYRFFWQVLKNGDIGVGEAYTKGLWDTPDLTHLLETFVKNREHSNENDFVNSRFGRVTNLIRHRLKHNNIRNSAQNIEAHYDLSNGFFETFLDTTMTYSSAVFEDFGEPLEAAQYRKIHKMLELADVQASDHVLEIGSGWGTLAIEAVKKTGCRVTTITLSKEQHKLVSDKIASEGLQDRITPLIRDYRLMEGQFDKIISVEMFEAVGHENFGTFFKSLDRLLKPGGSVAMQVITMQDGLYDNYRNSVDWIQKYIFPGGHVPSVAAIQEAVHASSPFHIEALSDYGLHYGETLRRWKKAFWEEEEKIVALGFDDEFKRIWNYYLCYCESGFDTGILGLAQFRLTR